MLWCHPRAGQHTKIERFAETIRRLHDWIRHTAGPILDMNDVQHLLLDARLFAVPSFMSEVIGSTPALHVYVYASSHRKAVVPNIRFWFIRTHTCDSVVHD